MLQTERLKRNTHYQLILLSFLRQHDLSFKLIKNVFNPTYKAKPPDILPLLACVFHQI